MFDKLKFKLSQFLFNKDKKIKKKMLSQPKKLKALLIGINYNNTSGKLYGCINDVRKMHKLLKSNGYTEFMILTEEDELKPTKENILRGFEWLIQDNETYNKIFLHYSGHGSWLKDLTSDEEDGRDECLVPLDYNTAGMITDDEIYSVFVNKIQTNFFGLIDACHSGSMLDLKYKCYMNPQFKSGNKNNLKNYTSNFIREENKNDSSSLEKLDKTFLMISGCKDEQTSADAWLEGKSQGALTYTFYKTLKYNRFLISTEELMKQIHISLQKQNFTQRPVISSNKCIRMRNKFYLF